MNNFSHFETRSLDLNLLNEMYAIPSKELSTNRITEILSVVTGIKLDNVMTSQIFNNAGLSLRERTRVTPKVTEVKPKRVTKAENVNTILGLLGLTPVVNGEQPATMTDEEYNAENREVFSKDSTLIDDDFPDVTEQEVQAVDEAIEAEQLDRNTESIYSNGINN